MKCYICLSELENEMIFLNCKCVSVYHSRCIFNWLDKKLNCPTCRKKFKKKNKIENIKKLKCLKDALFYDSINKYHTYAFYDF